MDYANDPATILDCVADAQKILTEIDNAAAQVGLYYIQPLGKEPFRRWEPFGIYNSSGFPNRIPAISLKNVQVGAVLSSTVYLQPL